MLALLRRRSLYSPHCISMPARWSTTPLAVSLLLFLLSFLAPSRLSFSSAASISFLASQPLNYSTVPANSSSISITVSYLYANATLLVYSNATTSTATLPGNATAPIQQLPPSESQSFWPYKTTSILLLPLGLDPGSEAYYHQCSDELTNPSAAAGLCNVTITFVAAARSGVAYSVYIIPTIELDTVYTSTLATNDWHYYALWITYAELDVLFELTPSPVKGSGGSQFPDVDLWLADVTETSSPLVPIFPTNQSGSYQYSHTGGQEVVELTAEGGWQDGLYIVGICAPASTRSGVTGYTLLLQSGVTDYDTTSGGVEVSMFAIVGALVVLVLCLFSAAAVIARRRRSYIRDLHLFDSPVAQSELMHRIQVRALADGRVVMGPVAEVYHGATESQIGRLPSHVYADGEMSSEDAKCTICLDDFVAGETTVKVLHCGHVYHDHCITTWLHTRKHCPLCLQAVDNAHDVAKHDENNNSTPTVGDRAAAAAAGQSAAGTTVATGVGSEDGVKIEVSAPSSTVVDSASSGRRSSSVHEDGPAVEMPNTPHSPAHEERKEQ